MITNRFRPLIEFVVTGFHFMSKDKREDPQTLNKISGVSFCSVKVIPPEMHMPGSCYLAFYFVDNCMETNMSRAVS